MSEGKVILLESKISHCELCGAPLKGSAASLGCLNCLLLGGPNEVSSETTFQHYELCLRADGVTLDELGRGAMGITYRALDVNLGSAVALKIISAGHSANSEARERFHREARAAAQLRHPNVASVFHFGETAASQLFYAMELIEGETLEARVHREGPLLLLPALEVATQVARALIAAEAHGLVHRDLKPSNLMVVTGDAGDADTLTVKVIDFGLAKAIVGRPPLSGQSHVGFSGTPEFASPEQFSPGEIILDSRSDIYSLGATIWYLLCGRPPFTDRALGKGHDQPLPLEQLAPLRLPEPLVDLLRSMLAADPAERPQSARELLTALQRCHQIVAAAPRRRQRLRLAALALGLLFIGAVGLTSYFSHRPRVPALASTAAAAPPDKSIAVLPFENLSGDKQDSFLAIGIVDEILTDLTKVADLKVICRTSMVQYTSATSQDLRKIATELGVAHVLMGSVHRVGPHLRVHAQLVNAATGTQIWAESFDRGVNDIFVVESELAKAMVAQLHAKLSPREGAAITSDPTSDLAAFELYSEASELLATSALSLGEEKRLQAARLLNLATGRDPAFLRAYCNLVRVHSELYLLGMDHTSARLRLAETALQNAARLQPEAGETHLAAAFLRYCQLDYDEAGRQLALAQRALPNEPLVYELGAYMDRRQGRWEKSERNFRRTLDLNPRNFYFLVQLSFSYQRLRRFDDMRIIADRALAVAPDDPGARINRAQADLLARANTKPERTAFGAILHENPQASRELAVELIQLALYERDFAAADRALAAMAETGGLEGAFVFPRMWYAGLIPQAKGDPAAAREAFTAARAQVATALKDQDEFAQPLCVLAMIDAALGDKEEAVAEGRRASELLLVTQDAITGADILRHLAVTFTWCGDKDKALEQLSTLSKIPSGVNYGTLRLDPVWDPLRGDPRFEAIVASLAPKDG